MPYVVEALLGTLKSGVLEGLQSGRYERWGGVIRVARGQPGAGTIVSMLREIAPASADPVSLASKVLAHGQMFQIQRQLGAVLQMTNIAAAASVLNIGVSAVGFAIMAAKLDRLQNTVNTVLQLTERNHAAAMAALARIEHQLVELRYIALDSRELLVEALDEVRELRRDIFDEHVAHMQAASIHFHASAPNGTSVETTWKVFTVERIWFASTIERATISEDRPAAWFDLLTRYRAWCVATSGEIQLARRIAPVEAAKTARLAAGDARRWATRWQQALLPSSKYGGVNRFEHRRFEDLHGESLSRLRRLQDVAPSNERAAVELAAATPTLGDSWFEQQSALGATLDFIEETVERIESVALETEWCAERRLNFEAWEQLPAPDDHVGLAVIDVEDDR